MKVIRLARDLKKIDDDFKRRLRNAPGVIQRHPIDGTKAVYFGGRFYMCISRAALAQLKRGKPS